MFLTWKFSEQFVLIFWIHILALPILEEQIASDTVTGAMVNLSFKTVMISLKAVYHMYIIQSYTISMLVLSCSQCWSVAKAFQMNLSQS